MTRRQDYTITRGDPERLTIVLREETVADPELRPLVLGTRALVWTIDLPDGPEIYSTASGACEYIDPYGIYWITLSGDITSKISSIYSVKYKIVLQVDGISETVCAGYISEGLSMARGGRHGGAPGVDLPLGPGDLGALARLIEARLDGERARAESAESALAQDIVAERVRAEGVEDELGARLALLETRTVAAIAVSPATAELGLTVAPVVSWTLAGTAPIVSLTVGGQAVAHDATTWTAPAVTVTTAYTVSVTDALGRVSTRSATVTFLPRVYWGVSSLPELTAADVLTLDGTALASGRARAITVDAAAQYIYYAYPKRYGPVSSVKIYGFSVEIEYTEMLITTTSGNTEIYSIIRSPYKLTDQAIEMEIA